MMPPARRQAALLIQTENAQPAIGLVTSQLALLHELGLQADRYAGHSFGEIMALHAAGGLAAAAAVPAWHAPGPRDGWCRPDTPGGMLAVFTSQEISPGSFGAAVAGMSSSPMTMHRIR